MFNLLKIKGTVKGNIGELLFCHYNKYTHWARIDNFHWLNKVPIEIPPSFKQFLIENWGKIDVFEFLVKENKVSNIVFYEVKTSIYRNKKQCLTSSTKSFYENCKQNGFIVKSVLVLLLRNWCYEIIEKDYSVTDYCIYDSPSKFLKKNSYNHRSV